MNHIFILFRAEKEYTLLSKQLKAELDEKKSIIRKLSTQLEEHTTNFNELKDELSKVNLYKYSQMPL